VDSVFTSSLAFSQFLGAGMRITWDGINCVFIPYPKKFQKTEAKLEKLLRKTSITYI